MKSNVEAVLEYEGWIMSHIDTPPVVFVIAYAGLTYKEWKLVGIYTKENYLAKLSKHDNDPRKLALSVYRSCMVVRVYESHSCDVNEPKSTP
jgi:hypothetical protein